MYWIIRIVFHNFYQLLRSFYQVSFNFCISLRIILIFIDPSIVDNWEESYKNSPSRKKKRFIHLLLFTPWEFFTWILAGGFSLKFEWQQVSWTLLRILAVLNNAVIWMFSTRPPTSRSFNNPLVTVPKAPITIGMIVTFMFHSFWGFFFQFLLFTFFQFYSVVNWDSKVHNVASSLYLIDYYYKVWFSGHD